MDVDRESYRFHDGAYIYVRKKEMRAMSFRFGNVRSPVKRAKGGFRKRGRRNLFGKRR